jgi:hypothetical protein
MDFLHVPLLFANFDLETQQMDTVNAFVHCDLDETVFIEKKTKVIVRTSEAADPYDDDRGSGRSMIIKSAAFFIFGTPARTHEV